MSQIYKEDIVAKTQESGEDGNIKVSRTIMNSHTDDQTRILQSREIARSKRKNNEKIKERG